MRGDVKFTTADGTFLPAWYRDAGDFRSVVVMAHGFSAIKEKQLTLHPYN